MANNTENTVMPPCESSVFLLILHTSALTHPNGHSRTRRVSGIDNSGYARLEKFSLLKEQVVKTGGFLSWWGHDGRKHSLEAHRHCDGCSNQNVPERTK